MRFGFCTSETLSPRFPWSGRDALCFFTNPACLHPPPAAEHGLVSLYHRTHSGVKSNNYGVPQKHCRLASLGAVVMLCVSSPIPRAFIRHRRRNTDLSRCTIVQLPVLQTTTAIYAHFPVQSRGFCRLYLVSFIRHKWEVT